jgi:hypothetical protein
MNTKPIDLIEFLHPLLDALQSAGIEYMLGSAIARWVGGEPRAKQDLNLVVNIPIEKVETLLSEPEKRDMLFRPDIILDTILENRTDLPINAIHTYSGLKADLYPLRAEDELRRSAYQRRQQEIDFGQPIGNRNSFFY